MEPMTPCPSCERHVREAEKACPFCGAAFGTAKRSIATKVLMAAAIGTSIASAACYGGPVRPPPEPTPKSTTPSATPSASTTDATNKNDDKGIDSSNPSP